MSYAGPVVWARKDSHDVEVPNLAGCFAGSWRPPACPQTRSEGARWQRAMLPCRNGNLKDTGVREDSG